jgi:hypothetical protein
MLWLYEKHLSGVVSNLKPIPQLWLYDHIMQAFDHLSIYATKRERKLLMSTKQNENLNKQNLSFLINKTTKRKVTAKTTFRIILLFRQQK